MIEVIRLKSNRDRGVVITNGKGSMSMIKHDINMINPMRHIFFFGGGLFIFLNFLFGFYFISFNIFGELR